MDNDPALQQKLTEIPARSHCVSEHSVFEHNVFEHSVSEHSVSEHKRKEQPLYHQMSSAEQQTFLQQLKSDYRQILLDYFSADTKLKQEIDQFINTAFSSNIPIPQIIKIHMELIEDFSRLLKLEGRGEEVLLDYRLTLIDILAHLCEIYRCSISKF